MKRLVLGNVLEATAGGLWGEASQKLASLRGPVHKVNVIPREPQLRRHNKTARAYAETKLYELNKRDMRSTMDRMDPTEYAQAQLEQEQQERAAREELLRRLCKPEALERRKLGLDDAFDIYVWTNLRNKLSESSW